VIVLLSVVTASATGQSPVQGRTAPTEIIIKLRAQMAGQETQRNDGAGQLVFPQSLETLHKRYGVDRIRPMLTGSGRQEIAGNAAHARAQSPATRREKLSLAQRRRGRTIGEQHDLGRIYRVTVDARTDGQVQELLEAYRRQPEVEYAELNHVIAICTEPDDPQYLRQWGMQKIGAPEAWDTCRGSAEVVVAVIDTGVDYNHRDIRANMWVNEAELHGQPGVDDDGNGYVDDIYGYNFAYNNADPMDDQGHGTNCAGTVAAIGNNGMDIAGVCWNARIMPLKILGADGEGTEADAAPAIYYAADNGADVISSSWGSADESQVIKDALAYARRRGVIVVAAAGNESTSKPFYPAAYPGVIAVAATDASDKRWYLSNYGDWVDIAAPGRDILSLRATGASSGTIQDAFTMRLSGTSTAAPHVTGTCVLLLAANPFLTYEEVEQLVLSTGDSIAAGICSTSSRVNVAKALRGAVPPEGSVRLDRAAYSQGDEIEILLADWDLRGAGTQSVRIETETGDAEELTLAETAVAKGVFRGSITVERAAVQQGDGRVQAEDGARVTVRYWHGGGASDQIPRWVETDARLDYEPPSIVDEMVETRGPNVRIDLTTSEPTRAEIRCGDTPGGPYPLKAADTELSDHHSISLGRLVPGRQYYFVVALVDEAGNEAIVDDAGRDYSITIAGDFAGFLVPTSYPTIQAAIDDAWNGDTVQVADGTYSGEGNTEIDFRGKAITVRSENGPQSCIIDCRHQGRAFHFHSGEGRDAVLDGFTIVNGGNQDYGGGIRCVASSPTIRNCTIRGNSASQYGGGLCNSYASSPTIGNCTFENNSCSSARAVGRGGAIANRNDSDPIVQDCTFVGNSAGYAGGAIGNFEGSSPRVLRCTFRANSAVSMGGAVGDWDDSHPEFTRCVFTGNSTPGDGGGTYSQAKSVATLTNCILYFNQADGSGGAVKNDAGTTILTNCTIIANHAGRSCGGIWSGAGSEAQLEDCILWGNTDNRAADPQGAQIVAEESDTRIDYCCVQGWTGTLGGIGNFTQDPLFVDPGRGDFHLRSRGWRWDTGRSQWTYDAATSPCIDAGNPGRPLGDEPLAVPDDPNNLLAQNVRIDMGAYGGTAEASMAPYGWTLLADLDNDGRVKWSDLACMAANWQAGGANRSGDLSRDGAVDARDFALLARQWRLAAGPAAVRIVTPGDGSIVPGQVGTPIDVGVEIGAASVPIKRIEFFAGARLIGINEDGSDGWCLNWQDYAAGPVILVARAVGQNDVQIGWAAVRIVIE